ncbi:MAG: hypothetical protein AAGA71_00210 [Pseudomonadota bacterium]
MEDDAYEGPEGQDETDPQTRPPREPGPVQPEQHDFDDWAQI